MISDAGSRRSRTFVPGLALAFALSLGLGQAAVAGINETEAGNSLPASPRALPEAKLLEEGLKGGSKAEAPIVVAGEKIKIDKNYKNKNKNWNKNWSKNNNKYIVTKKVYVQPWNKKHYYGNFFGGVVLGSILTAAAVGVAPPPPAAGLCWYWIDPYRNRGYWDYCPGYPLY